MNYYIYRNGKKMRCGFTTGACAAAASKAAAEMLTSGQIKNETELKLVIRAGVAEQREEIHVLERSELHSVSFDVENAEIIYDGSGKRIGARCAVRKDAGDDSDITDGMLICAEVRIADNADNADIADIVIIRGGEGVGVVTRAGLDRKPGEAAINSGPRRMITEAVTEVLEKNIKKTERTGDDEKAVEKKACNKCYENVEVIISVPEGRKAAEMTFNPVLGIEGGISILGTTGMVEPMSQAALAETVMTEIRVKHAAGCRNLCIVPGNYGMKAAEMLGIPEESVVKCSNFVGDAYETACTIGMESVVLIGNLGKFIKLAGGIFNTHSDNADARMDILMRCTVAAAEEMIAGGDGDGDGMYDGRNVTECGNIVNAEVLFDVLRRIDRCATTDAAATVLAEAGMLEMTSAVIAERIMMHIKRRWRAFEKLPETEVIVTANDGSVLGRCRN